MSTELTSNKTVDTGNTPTVRALLITALTQAKEENWHEVWRLCKSDLHFWLGHKFAKGNIKLTDSDFEILDEIEEILGDDYGPRSEKIDKECFIHPTFVRRELHWVRDTAKELLVGEIE